MVDPGTTNKIVTTGLVIWGSRDMLNKLLGPTAEYLGEKTKGLVEKADINLDNIFKKAWAKLGNRIEQPGIISPRILKNISDEGCFCEDELAAEYFGGILASSRSEEGRDDRGLSYLDVVKTLSVYQIRLHYYFYSLLRKKLFGTALSDLIEKLTFVPWETYIKIIDFSETEDADIVITHSLNGLKRHDLIQKESRYGTKKQLEEDVEDLSLFLTPVKIESGVNPFDCTKCDRVLDRITA